MDKKRAKDMSHTIIKKNYYFINVYEKKFKVKL